jgi:hypothetical protein
MYQERATATESGDDSKVGIEPRAIQVGVDSGVLSLTCRPLFKSYRNKVLVPRGGIELPSMFLKQQHFLERHFSSVPINVPGAYGSAFFGRRTALSTIITASRTA